MYRGRIDRLSRVILAPALSVLAAASIARAQGPAASSTADEQPTTYALRVTGDPVNIRSRPDLNSRVVGRVPRDSLLRAVSNEYGWHKILPPPGVFSLVSATHIQRALGSDTGVVDVTVGTLRVRVGSSAVKIDPLKAEVQTRLSKGAEVRIIGEQNGWYRIAPPEGVYFYISAEFVEQVSADEAQRIASARPSESKTSSGTPAAAVRPKNATTSQAPAPVRDRRTRPPVELAGDEAVATTPPSERESDHVPSVGDAADATKPSDAAQPQGTIEQGPAPAVPPPPFAARGVLRPSFVLPAGRFGLRYVLINPVTRKAAAYAEFDPQRGIDPKPVIGKYVGIAGKAVTDAAHGVKVIRVTYMAAAEAADKTSPTARP